jgi:hypothetical protein
MLGPKLGLRISKGPCRRYYFLVGSCELVKIANPAFKFRFFERMGLNVFSMAQEFFFCILFKKKFEQDDTVIIEYLF